MEPFTPSRTDTWESSNDPEAVTRAVTAHNRGFGSPKKEISRFLSSK